MRLMVNRIWALVLSENLSLAQIARATGFLAVTSVSLHVRMGAANTVGHSVSSSHGVQVLPSLQQSSTLS